MAKILATEIRVGNLLEFDKRVWRVLKSYHVHVGGRGGAYMQIEIKDIESGQKRNERLSTDEKIERPFIDRRTMTYSYHDGSNWVFMDNETYEQLTLGEDFLEGQTGYLMPNMEVEINFHNGRAIGIQLPTTVVLEVVDTEPGIKNAIGDHVLQARQARDRNLGAGAAVRQYRRKDPRQHRRRILRRARLTADRAQRPSPCFLPFQLPWASRIWSRRRCRSSGVRRR